MLDKIIKYASLFLVCFFMSCSMDTEEPRTPQNILNINQMSNVLVDFSLAESAANLNIKSVVASKIDSNYAFNPLKENGIRKTQFDSSLDFYCHHSQLYKKVYELVLAKLAEMETKNPLKRDSIK